MGVSIGQQGTEGGTLKTKYEVHQAGFSYRAHLAARREVYPKLFGTDNIEYEDTTLKTGLRGEILDGEMGIDVIVRPSHPELRSNLSFYIQERFRRPSYNAYGDVTLTEFNHASGEPSELYKIAADYLVYGYFDEERTSFSDAVAVDVARLKLALQHHKISKTIQTNKKNQSFMCFTLADLEKAKCLMWQPKSKNAAT